MSQKQTIREAVTLLLEYFTSEIFQFCSSSCDLIKKERKHKNFFFFFFFQRTNMERT